MHQAGSDSLLTAAVFFKMKQVQCKGLIEGEGFGFHVIRVRVCVCVCVRVVTVFNGCYFMYYRPASRLEWTGLRAIV